MAASLSAPGGVKGKRQLLWKFPCLICCKPVRCNQKGLFCDSCNRWCHSRCSDVSDAQYVRLSEIGFSTPWYCPTCTLHQLPFGNSSFVSDTVSSVSDVSCDKGEAGLPIVLDVLSNLRPGVRVIHHNIQGLVSKIVDVEQWVGDCVNTASVFCFSETWINHESPPVFTFPGFQGTTLLQFLGGVQPAVDFSLDLVCLFQILYLLSIHQSVMKSSYHVQFWMWLVVLLEVVSNCFLLSITIDWFC